MTRKERPLEISEILKILNENDLRFVISGSVAACIYGVDLKPNDLDIVPATDISNLKRLAKVLEILVAKPSGPFGDWTLQPDGELKWIPRSTTQEELDTWIPDINNIKSFDNVFLTRFGNLDIVPEVTGVYEVLIMRAKRIPAFGCEPWVEHIDEILARLTVPRRKKDIPVVHRLREIQRLSGEKQKSR